MSGRAGMSNEQVSLQTYWDRDRCRRDREHREKLAMIRMWRDLTSSYDGDEDRQAAFVLVRDAFPNVSHTVWWDFIPRFGLTPEQKRWIMYGT